MHFVLQKLLSALNGLDTATSIEQAVEIEKLSAGTFKDKEWAVLDARVDHFSKWDDHLAVIIEGAVNEYSDNNPLSPDGYSCLKLKFCITIIIDDIWHYRQYVDYA